MGEKILNYLFFFSSRRRHTRLTCDWSSDVCSSDLLECPAERSVTGDEANELPGPAVHGGDGFKEVAVSFLRVQAPNASQHERINRNSQVSACPHSVTRAE